jgi:hypothetical protein
MSSLRKLIQEMAPEGEEIDPKEVFSVNLT